MVKLYDKSTNQEIRIGDSVIDFRGESHIVHGLYPNQGKNGKIQLGADSFGPLYYPSVVNAYFDFENKISA